MPVAVPRRARPPGLRKRRRALCGRRDPRRLASRWPGGLRERRRRSARIRRLGAPDRECVDRSSEREIDSLCPFGGRRRRLPRGGRRIHPRPGELLRRAHRHALAPDAGDLRLRVHVRLPGVPGFDRVRRPPGGFRRHRRARDPRRVLDLRVREPPGRPHHDSRVLAGVLPGRRRARPVLAVARRRSQLPDDGRHLVRGHVPRPARDPGCGSRAGPLRRRGDRVRVPARRPGRLLQRRGRRGLSDHRRRCADRGERRHLQSRHRPARALCARRFRRSDAACTAVAVHGGPGRLLRRADRSAVARAAPDLCVRLHVGELSVRRSGRVREHARELRRPRRPRGAGTVLHVHVRQCARGRDHGIRVLAGPVAERLDSSHRLGLCR